MFILFKGEIQKGAQEERVIKRFATVFGVTVDKVTPLFRNEAVFFRNRLDQFTAEKYYQSLHRIGAKAYLGQDSDKAVANLIVEDLHKIKTVSCPCCEIRQVFSNRCVCCDNAPLQETTSKNTISNRQNPSENRSAEPASNDRECQSAVHSAKARQAFILGGILMVMMFILQGFLRKFSTFMSTALMMDTDISTGFISYAIATLVITYGCQHYALAKGYHRSLGLLGLLNIFGLGVIMLLPHRVEEQEGRESSNTTKLYAAAMIVFAVFWAGDHFLQNKNLDTFFQENIPFADTSDEPTVENSFPTDWTVALNRQEEILWEYINSAYELLSENDMNIDQIIQVTDHMYSALSGYSNWLNLQQFLSISQMPQTGVVLSEALIAERLFALATSIEQRNLSLNNPLLMRAHSDWMHEYHREDSAVYAIYKIADEIFDRLQNTLVYPTNSELSKASLNTRLEYMEKAYGQKKDTVFSEISVNDQQIYIRLRNDLPKPFSGKTIRFAAWEMEGALRWSYEKRVAERRKYVVFRRIGGNMSDKYLRHQHDHGLRLAAIRLLEQQQNSKRQR